MIKSMTAFTRQQHQDEHCHLQWEIRAVNHRYLDLNIHVPEFCRGLESDLRELAKQHLQRGKIDCYFRYKANEQAVEHINLNTTTLAALSEAQDTIKKIIKVEPNNLSEILRWPGVMQTEEVNVESLKQSIKALFKTSLEDINVARQREGDKLADFLLQRVAGIDSEVNKVRDVLPEALKTQKERLIERFKEASIELDPERLTQEMVLYTQRIDVAEELDRLCAHLSEIKHVLAKGGSIGRRLDFFMQELNREANTLGSKAANPMISHVSVELKVLIEQMREQVQNIE